METLTDFNWTPMAPAIAFGLSIAGNLICLAALIRACVLIYRLRAELEARDITEAWTQAERREVRRGGDLERGSLGDLETRVPEQMEPLDESNWNVLNG